MSGELLAATAVFVDALGRFDPAASTGEQCALIVEELAAAGKACDATRVLAAARVADCGAHHGRGFRNAVDWLAAKSGISAGAARDALDTARAVQTCPATKAALEAGRLSLAQAGEIARTEAVAPGCEAELVTLAGQASLVALKHRARQTRIAGVDAAELYARQHQARAVRHWRDGMGMVCLSARLRPDIGLRLVRRLDAEADRLGRAGGRGESRHARAADALAALVAGTAKSGPGGVDLVIVSDINPWRRGHAHPGEVCRIAGGDPIPVWLAQQLTQDAFLKAALHDGVAIHTVAHFGRHISAELRTALELGAPPDFDGAVCDQPGCGRRHRLEWDHINPVANGGLTSYQNLTAKCWEDHHAKTETDRQAGLLGPNPPNPRQPKPSPAKPAPAPAAQAELELPEPDPP